MRLISILMALFMVVLSPYINAASDNETNKYLCMVDPDKCKEKPEVKPYTPSSSIKEGKYFTNFIGSPE